MAERIIYDEGNGTVSIRKISCDMGHGTELHISVEADGDVCFDLWDKKSNRRIGEIEINNGATQTPGLAHALAAALREFAKQNRTE